MNHSPENFRSLCGCYRALLRFYPRAHREQFGELMLQQFRDQCRDASRDGVSGWIRFGALFADDFFSSLVQENLSSSHTMIRQLISQTKLPGILLVIAALLGLASISIAAGGQIALGGALAYLSLGTLLLRGIAEVFRPAHQWLRAIGWGVAVFVIYGFIMPAWAKVHIVPPGESPLLVFLLFIGLGSNLVVPIGKAIVALRARAA